MGVSLLAVEGPAALDSPGGLSRTCAVPWLNLVHSKHPGLYRSLVVVGNPVQVQQLVHHLLQEPLNHWLIGIIILRILIDVYGPTRSILRVGMNERSPSYILPHDDGSTAPFYKHDLKHMLPCPLPKKSVCKGFLMGNHQADACFRSVPVPLPFPLGWLAWLALALALYHMP